MIFVKPLVEKDGNVGNLAGKNWIMYTTGIPIGKAGN